MKNAPSLQPTQLEQQVQNLTTIVSQLHKRIQKFEDSSQYTFAKDIQILDGRKIKIGGTQGTKIGSSSSKIGLFGVTPVVQQASISTPSGGTVVDIQARSAIDSIITEIKAVGLTL